MSDAAPDPRADPPPAFVQAKPLQRNPASGPLWAQLRQALIDYIAAEALRAHTRLPSEPELCDLFSVSRTVVREALNQLVNEGQVYRIQGRGTFVAGGREDHDFVGTTVGFSSDFRGTDRHIVRQVLNQTLRPATAREAKFMRIAIDAPIVAIERLLVVDRLPRLWVSTAILPAASPSLETIALENRSLYETLRRQYGIVFKHAERWIEAINADETIAELLQVELGEALVKIESISFDQNDVPVEYYVAYQRTDKSRLHFRIRS
ncbi:GntR family transcriptional regulator [Jiella sonneratiae]|uniref:GntR family transcriptional regulator n=1 Tax=Jiella sonneratiae TaxID=2816856 RepID=A0ABS3J9V7_9HYPH|nr:GntR family transcriptional regulator [Jiella sonneratiae]MBO0906468.1 GntR family transcriptional regulator [Jiella sonneratiae]